MGENLKENSNENYFKDYFNEQTEFEEKIEEFKTILKSSVKGEIKEKISKLEKEVAEIAEIKKNWEKIKTEYEDKKEELENKIFNAEIEAKRARLTELFEACGMNVILYKAKMEYVQLQKCDKCDNDRKIHFKSPSGRDCTEDCECATCLEKYKPEPHYLTEFRIGNYAPGFEKNKSPLIMWFAPYKSEDDDGYTYWGSNTAEHIFNGEDFNQLLEIPEYKLFFRTEKECQEYCDYRNKLNGITEDML